MHVIKIHNGSSPHEQFRVKPVTLLGEPELSNAYHIQYTNSLTPLSSGLDKREHSLVSSSLSPVGTPVKQWKKHNHELVVSHEGKSISESSPVCVCHTQMNAAPIHVRHTLETFGVNKTHNIELGAYSESSHFLDLNHSITVQRNGTEVIDRLSSGCFTRSHDNHCLTCDNDIETHQLSGRTVTVPYQVTATKHVPSNEMSRHCSSFEHHEPELVRRSAYSEASTPPLEQRDGEGNLANDFQCTQKSNYHLSLGHDVSQGVEAASPRTHAPVIKCGSEPSSSAADIVERVPTIDVLQSLELLQPVACKIPNHRKDAARITSTWQPGDASRLPSSNSNTCEIIVKQPNEELPNGLAPVPWEGSAARESRSTCESVIVSYQRQLEVVQCSPSWNSKANSSVDDVSLDEHRRNASSEPHVARQEVSSLLLCDSERIDDDTSQSSPTDDDSRPSSSEATQGNRVDAVACKMAAALCTASERSDAYSTNPTKKKKQRDDSARNRRAADSAASPLRVQMKRLRNETKVGGKVANAYPLDLAPQPADDSDIGEAGVSDDESLSEVDSRSESMLSCGGASSAATSRDEFDTAYDNEEGANDALSSLEDDSQAEVDLMSVASELSDTCPSPYTDQASEGLSQLSMYEVSDGCAEGSGSSPSSAEMLSPFIPSLFPEVPPVINFCASDQKIKPLPLPLRKLLKWRLSTITPLIVKGLIARSGFRVSRKEHDWLGYWGKHMKSGGFGVIREFQKVNHFPGSFQIGRKDRLWRNLAHMQKLHGKKEFGFVPQTFVLPQDVRLLKRTWQEHSCKKWIVKPPASARGVGIKVISKWSQIPKKKAVIVQRYIGKPYLINETKFDLRVYVYVTSFDPLRVYIHEDGLVRFASCKYTPSVDSIKNKFIHLTNYSINKNHAGYTYNDDHGACSGHKWSLVTLWKYMKDQDINTNVIWENIKEIVIKTIISSESGLNSLIRGNVRSRYSCHELFGFDIILDEKLKPWVIEVNISPSLHSSSPLDVKIKAPMACDLFRLAGYRIPESPLALNGEYVTSPTGGRVVSVHHTLYNNNLSADEKAKHIYYTNKSLEKVRQVSILDVLTPADVRALVEMEDERSRRGAFHCLYPTVETHVYSQFFEQPRYFNLLLDGWLRKYENNGKAGK
ncbi:PREDICTED: tubulin polyglutamylase TTLL4-like [Priapulus caudatus]|uniref:Tubulin polyglutamylase TTLL4-like n=1 Tax=Priapulus caudatus TaxID=37621 RepID=A0ABM1EL38_PRICU|nr:PREDICTED: tubulin polyglutamylase TTLL4-like [Priapulus caudatus]